MKAGSSSRRVQNRTRRLMNIVLGYRGQYAQKKMQEVAEPLKFCTLGVEELRVPKTISRDELYRQHTTTARFLPASVFPGTGAGLPECDDSSECSRTLYCLCLLEPPTVSLAVYTSVLVCVLVSRSGQTLFPRRLLSAVCQPPLKSQVGKKRQVTSTVGGALAHCGHDHFRFNC